MQFYDFHTVTFGKWILAGEHAVVRGHEALVFPVKGRSLEFRFVADMDPADKPRDVGLRAGDVGFMFWPVLEHAFKLLGLQFKQIGGQFQIDNSIPVGQGMGASAALCVAISRWLVAQKLLPTAECNAFARELEHLFHGKSSGLDIAGVASDSGVLFHQGSCTPLKLQWKPQWYLSSCKQIGLTSHCVQQVQALWEQDATAAAAIDAQMVEAVHLCRNALEHQQPEALQQLAEAMNKACECFFKWGLVSENLQQHMQQLLDNGALAVKPTGSGGGGYVVSLWDKQPPINDLEMIEV